MIRAEQIPDEVVEALAVAWRDEMNSAHAIAVALNAWPGAYGNGKRKGWDHFTPAITLPLPQEVIPK